ncbi:ead/Ea22-like family protein [Atlantibacter hermannii]|uniref:ead/Ea22-like family protein n=1 Tax=Atlantibacter hermannii TaxID=565 RepID=UPI0028B15067|nr:ead/Ea22-like family protein [Atlantibacter hermannii]
MNTTEQAQREKFEAWAEEAGALPWGILGKHRKQDGNYPGPHYTYMWKAWQAASAELVEALESAHRKIAELENDEVRQRLANAEHQLHMAELAKHNLRASRMAQFKKRKAAEKRISEMEGREVREEGNQFLIVRYPGKAPVIKHCAGNLEGFLRQLLEREPMATINIVTHRYYGIGGQWVQDADEYLHMMDAAGRINGED